jgi:hypothetical protein
VRLTWSRDVGGRIFLAHRGGPARALYDDFDGGVARDVVIPSVGDSRLWTLSADSARSEAAVQACVLLPDGDISTRAPRVTVGRSET